MVEILGPDGHPARATLAGWEQVANPNGPPGSRTFMNQRRQLAGVLSQDMGRWHLSVSHRRRVPRWGELGEARDALVPSDAWMMVPHPPRKYWMNLDRRVLHLWEFRDPELIEHFRWEGEQAQRLGYGTPDSGEANDA